MLALGARRLVLQGHKAEAAKQLTEALHVGKTGPRVLLISARLHLDEHESREALQALTRSLSLGADPIETNQGLAWLQAATADAPQSRGRLALLPAMEACHATGGRDWSSLAAVAVAYARSHDYAKAQTYIDAALAVAPDTAVELCQTWQTSITNKQPVDRDWK